MKILLFTIVTSLLLVFPEPTSALPYRQSLEGNDIDTITALTIPDQARDILAAVIQNSVSINKELQNQFWKNFSHFEPLTKPKRQLIKDRLVGKSITLQSYLYRDTLISIYLKEPFKSDKRKHYELYLMTKGLLTSTEVNNNEKKLKEFMELDEKIPDNPNKQKDTHMSLQKYISELTETETRINTLFELPSAPETTEQPHEQYHQ